ncbi:MarR family winged helix-turn-helix transcriptional regulator [Epibacterium sp. Ofav1-8]|uniref:MarR family winged helix-turn-helix transcriptional regulator n=1 Tax=Epibacterium sp. Ofav1-8 TaxID=2917735 RepID=UPI001EF72747|nr:MarR family winged helix-turn-helix transcriptional regulator [Epibacterium sp. Ofav1-8]MCG7622358.1 MarR family winged helix-turn-helix transcriptional regulator [Epibacterium sp. Ofav1-8]
MPERELELDHLPATLIRRLNQISVARFATAMSNANIDLTPVQYAALAALAARPGVDQATLAALIGYDRATLGKVVERLDLKHLVRREVRPEDRRARSLHLTPAGAALHDAARPLVEALQTDILAGLSRSERQDMLQLLRKATEAAEAGDHDAPPMVRSA